MAGFSNIAEWNARTDLFIKAAQKDVLLQGVIAGSYAAERSMREVLPPTNRMGLFHGRSAGTGLVARAIVRYAPIVAVKKVTIKVGLTGRGRAATAAHSLEFGARIVPKNKKVLAFIVGGKRVFTKLAVIPARYWFQKGWPGAEAKAREATENRVRAYLVSIKVAE